MHLGCASSMAKTSPPAARRRAGIGPPSCACWARGRPRCRARSSTRSACSPARGPPYTPRVRGSSSSRRPTRSRSRAWRRRSRSPRTTVRSVRAAVRGSPRARRPLRARSKRRRSAAGASFFRGPTSGPHPPRPRLARWHGGSGGATDGRARPTRRQTKRPNGSRVRRKSAGPTTRPSSGRSPNASGWSALLASYRSSARSGATRASRFCARSLANGSSRSGRRFSDHSSALPSGSSLSAANISAERPVAAQPDVISLDLVSHSSLHTERLGERLGRSARPNDVFALWGELGAGKTVLARGVAIGLGIDPSDVASPTFIILRESFGGRLPFFHIDLYRLEGADLTNTGWEECLEAGGVTVIEWPDRAGAALPDDRLDIRLEPIAETKRRVVVEATGPRSARLVGELRTSVVGA